MKHVVYVDTNIIIEAHRTGCWKALVNKFEIHTVESVFNEALAGRKNAEGYIEVPADNLKASVTMHSVTRQQMTKAVLDCPNLHVLDQGEKDLLAYVHAFREEMFILTTADVAAVFAACELNLMDRLVSLEELIPTKSQHAPLKAAYTREKLSQLKTDFRLR